MTKKYTIIPFKYMISRNITSKSCWWLFGGKNEFENGLNKVQ